MNVLLALRLALRGLRADRATSISAIAILSLGLAAPAVFFSILWGGGMRPLPVPGGEEIVRLEIRLPRAGGVEIAADGADLSLLAEAPGLAASGGFRVVDAPLRTADHGSHSVPMVEMVPGTFELLGIEPILGRIPAASESGTTYIIGHRTWRDVFDADPGVVGTMVSLDGETRTVSAVMPEGFAFPFNHHAWTVAPARPEIAVYEAVGRLAAGVTMETVSAQIAQLWNQADAVRAPDRHGAVTRVRGFTHGRGEGGEAVAFGGLVMVGLCLLLIAIANTTSLLLVRAIDRTRVLGVQAALGASRLQLAGQMLAESLILSAAGGLVGLFLTNFMVDYVQRSGSRNFGYYWMEITVDRPVLIFSALLVLGTALLASMAPVAATSRIEIQRVLKIGKMAPSPSRFSQIGRVLVSGQLAVACGALVAAALTGQALATARDFGGDMPADEILVVGLEVSGAEDGAGSTATASLRTIADAVARRPEVEAAAFALAAPGYFERFGRVEVEGETYERPQDRPGAIVNATSTGFDPIVGVSLLQGRLLSERDDEASTPVAVVSRSFAADVLGEDEPIGRRIRVEAVGSEWAVIVGVIADLPLTAGRDEMVHRVHFSIHQVAAADAMLLVRTVGPAADQAGVVRSAIWSVDPDVTLSEVQTLAEGHQFMTRAQSTLNTLGVAGGGAGLLVSIVGLFALLSFHVRRRAAEFGVRMALGADRMRVVVHIMRMASFQLVPAVLLGSLAAWLVAPALGPLLLGADPRAAGPYVLVSLAFLSSGLGAALVPALRAARTRPSRALSAE